MPYQEGMLRHARRDGVVFRLGGLKTSPLVARAELVVLCGVSGAAVAKAPVYRIIILISAFRSQQALKNRGAWANVRADVGRARHLLGRRFATPLPAGCDAFSAVPLAEYSLERLRDW